MGGMGVVYRAHDTVLERIVALKLVAASYVGDPEMRERFFREARAAGHLTHKNIITIYDLGEHDGRPYLAMEYLAGENLQRRLERPDRMPLSRRLEVALEICLGVEHAHVHGIVHRDLKPANIFLTESGAVKILDFGLARPMASQLTHSHMLMGTLNYMSPEQVRGERADHRSDIFSLGVVLYELFGGRKAFEGDSVASTLYRILEDLPEPLHNFDHELPPALWTIVERALAKNREDRYQQVSALLGDLYELHQTNPAFASLATGPLTPRPSQAPRYLDPASGVRTPASGSFALPGGTASRGRIAAAAAVVLLLAGVAGVWLFKGRQVPAQPAPTAAELSPVQPAAEPPAAPTPVNAASPVPASPAPEEATARRREQDAETARGRMREGRAAAEAAGAAARASAGFRNAVRRADEGDRLFKAGDFVAAAARYYEASGLFRYAENAARTAATAPPSRPTGPPPSPARAEPSAAAPAAQEPPREAPREPEPSPPGQATGVPVTAPAPPTAAPQEPAASTPPAAAAQPAAPPPAVREPPAPEGPSDTERVSRLLDRYRDALESRSLDRLKQAWPSLGGAAENAIREEFQHSSRISVEIVDPQIAINGATGRVTFVRNYGLTTVDGQRLQSRSQVTMTVRRGGSGWVIESVRFAPR
jgi:serine/threonine-protein kinase